MYPTITLPTINTGRFAFGKQASKQPGRDASAPSFIDFVSSVNPRYIWYPHVKQLAAILQQVADDEIDRLMVFMPPRHGKSELVSRLFSAYYLYCHPDRWVGINSYAAELAYTFSRNSRENYTRFGGNLRGDAYAVKHWETGRGGGLWAAGVGGPITGKGMHLGIIDDPLKNSEEANSEVIRQKQADWYDSTFYTRQEPGAAIVVIQTRWNEGDLSGYILSKEYEEPEHWHIIHFEAVKDTSPPEYPPTCIIEPDTRRPGEALAPQRYPLEKLKKIAARIGSYFYNALYQQRPAPREGNMFKREWFEIVPGVPGRNELVSRVRYWDKAGTKDAGAHTAGVLLAKFRNTYYIEHVIMGQWGADEREAIIKQTAEADREMYGRVTIGVEQEPGSGGKESAEATIKMLAGFAAYADRPTGDKVLRAEPFAAQCSIHNVKLVRGDWNGRYLDILTAFPYGTIKDPVDASSAAFNHLSPGGANKLPEQPTQQSKWTQQPVRQGSRWRM